MSTVATLNIRIGADWTEAQRAFREVQSAVKPLAGQLQSVGQTLTTAVTVPMLAAGGAALKASIDFESAFAGVRKTVNASETEFAALESGIREMSTEIPASASAIASVAESAGQLGIETGAILEFSRTMIDLGESSNISADQAATSLARLANITQMPQDQFDNLASTVVALGNSMATTEAEIVEMGLRLAGAGNQVGMTEAEILALSATLSSLGVRAEAGGTSFSTLLLDMQAAVQSGSAELASFAQTAGMSVQQFATLFRSDAATALDTFIRGLGAVQQQGGNVTALFETLGITTQRTRDALLRASGAGDTFAQALGMGTQKWVENLALTTEAQARYATTASQLRILWNRFVEVGRTIGDVLKPRLMDLLAALEPVFQAVERGVEAFGRLPAPVQNTALAFGGLVTAAGPFAFMTGTILLALPQMAAGMSLLVTRLGTLATAFATLRTAALAAWAAATGPIGLAVAAGGALGYSLGAVAGIITKRFRGVSDEAEKMRDRLDSVTAGLGVGFSKATGGGAQMDFGALDRLGASFSKMQQQVRTPVTPAPAPAGAPALPTFGVSGLEQMQGIAVQAESVGAQITETMRQIGTLPMPNPLAPLAAHLGTTIKKVQELAPQVQAALMQIPNASMKVASIMQQTFSRVTGVFSQFFTDAVTTLATGIGKLAAGQGSLGDIGRGLIETLAGALSQLGTILITAGTAFAAFGGPGGLIAAIVANPMMAIAAGAALVGIGAAIKGAMSSPPSPVGGGGAGVGGVSYSVQAGRRGPGDEAARAGMSDLTTSPLSGSSTQRAVGAPGSQQEPVHVTVEPRVTSAGDLEYATREGKRRLDGYGTDEA